MFLSGATSADISLRAGGCIEGRTKLRVETASNDVG